MRGRRGVVLGRLVVTTVLQGAGAPIVDKCGGRTADGRLFDGVAIHLSPWLRLPSGDRDLGDALVLGWLRPAGGAT